MPIGPALIWIQGKQQIAYWFQILDADKNLYSSTDGKECGREVGGNTAHWLLKENPFLNYCPLTWPDLLLQQRRKEGKEGLCHCYHIYLSINWSWHFYRTVLLSSPRARRACALRALGLLLADGTPTVGGGKTFWAVSQIFLRKQL